MHNVAGGVSLYRAGCSSPLGRAGVGAADGGVWGPCEGR